MILGRQFACAVPAFLLLATGFAGAQVAPPNMAAIGGQMHAMAEGCGDDTDAQLRRTRQQQRTAAGTAGLKGPAFDEAFDKAYDDTRGALAAMSKAQKDKICRQLKSAHGAD